MDLIETGKIVNTHGVKGDVKLLPWTSDISRLLNFEEFYIDKKSFSVENIRVHKDMLIIKFHGIDSPEAAEFLRNKTVEADASLFELEEGEFFIRDLIGISVYDADNGAFYGKISEILQSGANDVYELSAEGENGAVLKRYIPAIKDCIISTDINEKIMKIRPLEGLFDI